MTRPHLIVSGVVVGLLLISTFTPSHAEKPIEPLMDQCLLRLAWQSTEEEVATMADACPLLLLKLQERGWVETLEGIAAEDLTAAQLSTYVGMAERWGSPERGSLVPLAPVLANLDLSTADELSLLDQVKAWIADLFPDGTGESLAEFLRRILPGLEISEATWSLIGDFFIAAIIGGALLFIVLELQRAGVFSRQRGTPVVTASQPAHSSVAPRANDYSPATLFDQLITLLAQRFGRTDARSLSHRETGEALSTLAELEQPTRDALRELTDTAERIRYGAWQPAEEEISSAMPAGKSVLASIQRKPGS